MPRRVAVVGGGVIGLLCAYYLRQGGAEALIVERGSFGAGCSFGNAGWVVPSLAQPIPAPGLRRVGLRWLLRPDSPLYLAPSTAPALAPWLWRFWLSCTDEAFARGAEALMAHAAHSIDLYRGLLDDGVDFEWHRDGLVMAFRSPQALEEELAMFERFGYAAVEALSVEELTEIEPSLGSGRHSDGKGLIGGIHVLPEAHLRPETLTAGLAARCAASGVEMRSRFPVERLLLERSGGVQRARGLSGPQGVVEADDFVLATGAELGRLARQCGVALPIQAGKGYSVTVEQPRLGIRRPLHFAEAKVAVTPFSGGHRIAGTLELSGINSRLDRRRLASVERAAERELPGVLAGARRRDWVGMRPLTPDGLPVLGRLPGLENVWVSGGHQMLGITLAPASGRLLASCVLESESDRAFEERRCLEAFSPGRFARGTER